jgi:hypothetical protein
MVEEGEERYAENKFRKLYSIRQKLLILPVRGYPKIFGLNEYWV